MQAALDDVWPYTHELFTPDDLTARLAGAGIAPDQATLREPWLATIDAVLTEATLTRPEGTWTPTGSRVGPPH